MWYVTDRTATAFLAMFNCAESHEWSQTAGIIGIALAPGLSIALATLTFLVPMLVQTILLFRVVTVYPPSKLSWRRRILIYAPFVVLKTGRLINGVIFLAVLYKRTDSSNPLTAGVVSWTLPEIKIEWFLQLSDNTSVSSCVIRNRPT